MLRRIEKSRNVTSKMNRLRGARLWRSVGVSSCLFLANCADRLVPNPADAEAGLPSGQVSSSLSELPSRSGNFSHEMQGSAYFTVVDATNYETFQYLDLDSGEANEVEWDLAFRRFLILSNGGASGSASVQIAKLRDVDFETFAQAPESDAAWQIDRPDGADDEDSEADTAFNDGVDDWYDYDVTHHSLSSKGYLYVIRTSEDRYYKLKLASYYDDVGTSGIVSFLWAEIEPPEGPAPELNVPEEPAVALPGEPTDTEEPDESVTPDEPDTPDEPNEPDPPDSTLTVDASSYENFVYLSVEEGVIEIAAPETSTEWDLALRRYVFLTNGGTSGPGLGGARLYEGPLTFDELLFIDSGDFVQDEILAASGAPGSTEGTGNIVLQAWYDYGGLGALSPKDAIYLIRTAQGDYAKLRILSYSGGIFTLTLLPLAAATD